MSGRPPAIQVQSPNCTLCPIPGWRKLTSSAVIDELPATSLSAPTIVKPSVPARVYVATSKLLGTGYPANRGAATATGVGGVGVLLEDGPALASCTIAIVCALAVVVELADVMRWPSCQRNATYEQNAPLTEIETGFLSDWKANN